MSLDTWMLKWVNVVHYSNLPGEYSRVWLSLLKYETEGIPSTSTQRSWQHPPQYRAWKEILALVSLNFLLPRYFLRGNARLCAHAWRDEIHHSWLSEPLGTISPARAFHPLEKIFFRLNKSPHTPPTHQENFEMSASNTRPSASSWELNSISKDKQLRRFYWIRKKLCGRCHEKLYMQQRYWGVLDHCLKVLLESLKGVFLDWIC